VLTTESSSSSRWPSMQMALTNRAPKTTDAQMNGPAHLRAADTIGALLNHPAFAGNGRLMLPWDGRQYDEKMRLADIGELLLYHSRVDTNIIVASLNRMIDDASGGATVFYPIYSEAERRRDPTLCQNPKPV
jgi:hypothetical protein